MSIQFFSLVTYFNLLFLIPAGFSPFKLQQPDNQDKQLQQEVASASSYFYNPEDPFEYEDCDDLDLCDDYWYNGYGYPKDSKGSKDCADADAAEATENCAIKTATCSAAEATENCAIETATCSASESTENCAIETATCSASESTIGHTTVIPDLGSAITCLIATELDGAIQTAALSHVGLSVDNCTLGTSSLCKPTGSRGNVDGTTIDPAITNAAELAIQTAVGNATAAIGSAVNHALELAVERNISSTINRVVDCAVNDAIDAAISRSIGSLNGAIETATENAIVPVVEQTVDRVLGPAIDSAIASRSTDSVNRAITPAVMNIVDSAIDVAVERALVVRLEPRQIVSSHATLIEPAVNCAVSDALDAAMDCQFRAVKPSVERVMTLHVLDTVDTTIAPTITKAVDSTIDAAIDFALTDATQIAMDKAETIEPAVNSVVDHAFNDAIDRCITSVGPDIDRIITSRVGVAIDRALVAQLYPPQIASGHAAIIEPD